MTLPRQPRFDRQKAYGPAHPFNDIQTLYETEIEPLIKKLFDESLSEGFKHTLRKYLVVIIFACLETFFRNESRELVNNNNMNLDSIFPPKFNLRLSNLLNANATTRGSIVASSFRFVDFYEIDFVFSNLLRLNSFLDYVIKLNDLDQTRFVLDGHPLPIDYEELKKAYILRNEIVHEVKIVKTSKSKVIALWDSLLNIMDLSRAVFLSASDSSLRSSLDSDYEHGRERAKNKGIYKLSSDKIMSKLSQKGKLKLTRDKSYSLYQKDLHHKDTILKQNMNWVIPKMHRERLILINRNEICLTSKGEKRFKKTRKASREKWKRDASNILCTWMSMA